MLVAPEVDARCSTRHTSIHAALQYCGGKLASQLRAAAHGYAPTSRSRGGSIMHGHSCGGSSLVVGTLVHACRARASADTCRKQATWTTYQLPISSSHMLSTLQITLATRPAHPQLDVAVQRKQSPGASSTASWMTLNMHVVAQSAQRLCNRTHACSHGRCGRSSCATNLQAGSDCGALRRPPGAN